MGKIFYKKSTAIGFLTAALVLVLLLCMLLVILMQMSTIRQRSERLHTLIEQYNAKEIELQELLDGFDKDEFVIKWAEEHGYIEAEDVNWIEEELHPKQEG